MLNASKSGTSDYFWIQWDASVYRHRRVLRYTDGLPSWLQRWRPDGCLQRRVNGLDRCGKMLQLAFYRQLAQVAATRRFGSLALSRLSSEGISMLAGWVLGKRRASWARLGGFTCPIPGYIVAVRAKWPIWARSQPGYSHTSRSVGCMRTDNCPHQWQQHFKKQSPMGRSNR